MRALNDCLYGPKIGPDRSDGEETSIQGQGKLDPNPNHVTVRGFRCLRSSLLVTVVVKLDQCDTV